MNTWRDLPGKIWVTLASFDPRLGSRARDAAESLTPRERGLFMFMNRYDLAHSLAVASRFEDEPLLYKAALLHDAGKLRSDASMFSRWLYTGMELFMPLRLKRISTELEADVAGDTALQRTRSLPRGWRRGIYLQLHHGEVGADLLRDIDSDREVIRLVRGHQGESTDELSRRLAEVDDIF
ncbi:MAG: HD domain-containing protein [Actinomycetota bacterium]|nr:HD domain-containing protein [Actinomycetota bacterium]